MKSKNIDVLWKNEVNSNRVLTVAMAGAAVMFAIVFFLIVIDVFYVYRWNSTVIMAIMLLVELLLINGVLLSRHYHYEHKKLKVVLMGDVILVFAIMNMIFTYAASILMVIPIILSSRYFSREYTVKVSVVTIVVFFFSTILGALYGNYDVNNLQLAPHTLIDLGEEMWIADVIDNGGILVDNGLMVKNVLLFAFIPNLILTDLCIVISVVIAEQGRKMVLEQKVLAENSARVETELSLATKIQSDMLPHVFPVFPNRTEFEIYASMTPAKNVGGDFYDFFLIDDNHLCLLIADVSGKGIPAALFMMSSKIMLNYRAQQGGTPSEILTAVNFEICKNNKSEMFVTVWMGILELNTGIMTCCNAGHECPVVRGQDGVFRILNDQHNFVVGGLKRTKYKDYEIRLAPGDAVFVYTDGVPEANNSTGEFYGEERMEAALNRLSDCSPAETLQGIRKDVDAFTGEAEQFDDLTMMMIEYHGVPHA